MVDNYEIFEEFYRKVKEKDIKDILIEYGGSNLYIPSYKNTKRNEDIKEEFTKMVSLGKGCKDIIRYLAKKYMLSDSQIYAITSELREPSLF